MLSIIICSIDPAKYAAVTANYTEALAGHPHEIIGLHDARSLAEAYNRGARRARGDILIFSHDDVEIVSPDLAGAISRATATLDVAGIVGTSKVISAYWPNAGHPYLHGWITQPAGDGTGFYVGVFGVDGLVTPHLQALDGMFFAARRHVVEKSPFDEATFDGFDGYDMDFSFAAYLAGFNVGTTAEVALIHASGGDFGEAWQRYALRFDHKYRNHLPPARPPPKWSFGRALVSSREALVREFPLEKLVATTQRLRAAYAPSAR
jgi:GT2 family glycosyltransferase